MPRSRAPYPSAFRQQMVDLVRAGRSPEALAKEFEPTAQAIRNWVKQDDLDQGRREDGLRTEERAELRRLRRENRQLRMDREILAKAAAWFARETEMQNWPVGPHPSLLVHKGKPGLLSYSPDVRSAGCLPQRLLRLAQAGGLQEDQRGCYAS